MKNSEKTMEKIVALCKGRGFIFSGSEIYGGLANTWDYGPLGVELKNNVKKAWWKKFVQENPYNVGLDAAILMNPQTWVASGHLGGFSDPLMDCKECKERFRADKLIEDWCSENGVELDKPIDAFSQEEMNHLTGVCQQPESLRNGQQALADYIRIVQTEAEKRLGGRDCRPAAGGHRKIQRQKGYWRKAAWQMSLS